MADTNEIKLTINGKDLTARPGQTILEVARDKGIDIPTLCYLEGLLLLGACRICVVEVEGSRTLVGSCYTPVTPGMVVQTHSPKVLQARKVLMELLLASHCGSCYMCQKANICEFRKMAAEMELGLPRFTPRKRYYPIEEFSPNLAFDRTKCILCRRCVRACRDKAGKSRLGVAYRGFDTKIIYGADQPIDAGVCQDCDACVAVCPTGSLYRPYAVGQKKEGEPMVIRG
ncbi:MAG: 2Fe-2S iron-sulfur cluster-binding protein [Chloroflexota bacterium]